MEDSDIKGNNIKGMQKLIYKYIENSIDDRDFERITPINETHYMGWKTYYKFRRGNKRIVKNIYDVDELKYILKTIDKINLNRMRTMDKEFMAAFRASGLCFNKKKQLVIFNSR